MKDASLWTKLCHINKNQHGNQTANSKQPKERKYKSLSFQVLKLPMPRSHGILAYLTDDLDNKFLAHWLEPLDTTDCIIEHGFFGFFTLTRHMSVKAKKKRIS